MDPELIKRFFNNQCSRQEVIEVLAWIESLKSREEFERDFDAFMQAASDEPYEYDLESLYETTRERLNIEQLISSLSNTDEQDTPTFHLSANPPVKYTKTSIWSRILKIAATILLLMCVGAALYVGLFREQNPVADNLVNQIMVKETGKGQKLTTRLPDGSTVIMNYQTVLKYPDKFSDSLRTVEIQGEAYFDVIKDTDKPFIVKAGHLNVKVLGTSFSVAARNADSTSTISLVSGRVEIKSLDVDSVSSTSIIMDAGESVVYNLLSGGFKKSAFIPEHLLAWKNGIIQFDKASYKEVMNELENWFDVQIYTQGPVPDWSFTAKFENENLRNILEGIEDSQDVSYDLIGKKIIIHTK